MTFVVIFQFCGHGNNFVGRCEVWCWCSWKMIICSSLSSKCSVVRNEFSIKTSSRLFWHVGGFWRIVMRHYRLLSYVAHYQSSVTKHYGDVFHNWSLCSFVRKFKTSEASNVLIVISNLNYQFSLKKSSSITTE